MNASPTRSVPDASRRVLLVEDDDKTARDLGRGLEGEGYDVEIAATGEDGFYRATTEPVDLVILDVRLPGRDGFEVLQAVRGLGIGVPILMLTACDTTEDRVRGLDAGADDYLVKPYSFAELVARVRALLRRSRPRDASTLSVDDLVVDLDLRRVSRRGLAIELTTRELDLLVYLVRHRNQIVSREMLARDVWQESMRVTSLDNVIDVHMTRLRKKIDRWPDRKLIHTVRGVGFIVRASES
jgi:two-component system copper resistance phosphate regulon response regulator CusR